MLLNFKFNFERSERILKSPARTEVTLVESHNIVRPEVTNVRKRNER